MKIEWAAESPEGGPATSTGSIEFRDTWCLIRHGSSGQFIEYDTVNSLSHFDGYQLQWRCLGCSYTTIYIYPKSVLERIFDELMRRVLASHGK